MRRAQGKIRAVVLVALGGLVVGAAGTGALVWTLMPGQMLAVRESRLAFDETVRALERSIEKQGCVHSGTTDMNERLSRHGEQIARRVKIIKLCKPACASGILESDPHMACMMPCSSAVWEDDAGAAFVSKVNAALMGRMFGGSIAEIMDTKVARDEEAILSGVLKD